MAQVRRPQQRESTGNAVLDFLASLVGDPTLAPGPAAMASPVRFIPMGQGMPAWLQPMIQRLLGGAARGQSGQPAFGMVGNRVPAASLVGAAVEAEPQLLTVADRLRPFFTPQQAPLSVTPASGGAPMPSNALADLMSLLQQATRLSSRQ